MLKRNAAILMVLILLLTAFPMAVFAEDTEICPISATATAPSEGMWYVGQGDISSIIDGKDDTFFMRKWVDIADCTTFDLTLDNHYDLTAARIVWGGSNANCAVATAYDVYVSADGVLYTKAASVTGNTDRGEDFHRTDRLVMQSEKVKYVRLCVYGQNPNTALSLAEVSFEGTASGTFGEKIYPKTIVSPQSLTNYPTANLTDGNAETYWRIGEWQQGSESTATENTDAVLTATLPHVTDLTSVDFSLVSYFPEGETNFYTRTSTVKAFEIEVSENGVDYRKVYRFDGNLSAMISIGEAHRTDGCSVKEFTGSVTGVKYVRITFKNYSRLALNDLCVRGTDSENGLKTGDIQIRLAQGTTRSGMHFTVDADKAAFGMEGTFALNDPTVIAGVMLLSKATLQESGFATIAARVAAGTTSGIIDLTAEEILAQDAQSFTYAAVRTQIPLNEFNTVYAIVPYVKNGSTYTFGKQTEASYAGLKTVGNFLYPTEGTWEVNPEDFARTIGSKTYLDVAAAASVTPVTDDWSVLLPESVENYYFAENTVCPVDADTMYRVIGNNCVGAGAIKWTEFEYVGYVQNPDQYDGVLPVSKMDDPLYVQMCLPNEVASPMGTAGRSDVRTPQGRINASNLFAVTDHINALPIGAIFLNPEKEEIPDDAEITLCFGNITLCARTVDSDGWFLASQRLCQPANFFPFPWTLPIDGYRLRDSQQSVVDGHYEVKLTGAELKGKRFDDDRVVTGILHFWGDFLYYDIGDVLGMASSYVVWVKEPVWSGYLTADIGADIRRADGSCDQAFTGINYEITDEPRLVFGHNVGPKAYDEVMDSEKVLELIEWDKYKSRNSLVMREHNNSGKQEICPISATTTARSEDMWYVGQGEISSIIDGNDNTFFMRKWVDIADCTTFDLTLDGYYDLETARIVWGGSNANCAVATAYDVYVSADGVLYTKAASVTGNTERGEDLHRTDRLVMQAEKVKYVRLCVYGQNPNTALSLAEVSFEGWASRAPGAKIYPTAVQSSESHSNHPTSNLTDGNTETYWRIGEWQQGSESAAKHTDAVLTAELPYKTNLTSVDFSLISYFPEGETNFYTRHSLIKAFEIEVSENGVDYRKVYRFDGEAKATVSIGEALRTDGFSVKDFTGSVKNVKYIRITFKNHYRLALNDLCVRGNESVTFR